MEHCLSFLITGTCRRGRNCHEDHPTITHGNRTIVMLRGYYKVDSKEINEAKLKVEAPFNNIQIYHFSGIQLAINASDG